MKMLKRAWNLSAIIIALNLFSAASYSQTSLNVTITANGSLCLFDCTDLIGTVSGGTAPYAYEWYINGQLWSNGGISTFCPFDWGGAGTYEIILLVTDSNGDVSDAILFVTATPCTQLEPVIEGPIELCIGECGTFFGYDLNGSNILEYQWSDPGGTVIGSASTIDYCPTNSGTNTLTLTIFDDFGYVATTLFNIFVTNTIPLEIVSTSPTSCPDNGTTSACDKTCANSTITYIVPGNPGTDLEWEVLGAESYEVDNNIVTVNWGNPGTGEINVTSASSGVGGSCALQLNVSQVAQDPDGLPGGGIASASIGNGIPPISYVWSNGFVGSPATGLPAGTYQVTATDATGLSEVGEVTIELTDQTCDGMVFNSVQVIHPTCNTNDGSISVTVLGGTGGYSYIWSNGNTTPNNVGIQADIHCVTVTDAFGCSMTNCYNVCDPLPISINAFTITDASGPGVPNGAAGVQAFGGAGSYYYQWDTGQSGPVVEGLPSGIYGVTVTDANGCTVVEIVTINWISFCALKSHIEINSMPSTCNSFDGSVTVFSENSAGSNEYDWSDGVSGSSSRSDLGPGTYCVTVTDATDCTSEHCVVLTCNPDLSSSGCIGQGSLCIDIIEEPQARFSTEPDDVNGIIEICRGESVTFHNESDNAENYVWELGDGYSTSAVDVTHAYTQSGIYDVLLIARNECFCIDTTSIKVLVSTSEIPEINCVGTVCESAEQTYTTSADCGVFNWIVSGNGVITDGGGTTDDFVTVNWGTGPMGEVSLQVSGCSGDYCANPTTVSIPIITDGVFIEGPEKVCPGEIGTYMVPQWSATEYVWSASPFGEIKSGQGTNTVNIKWNVETAVLDPQWVHVEYNNCFLECGGESTKDVSITPDFYLAGPIEVCESTSSDYAAFNEVTEGPVSCNWIVSDQNGSVISTSGPSPMTTINWPAGAGKYTLTAIAENPDDYCSDDYTIIVSVIAGPPQVNGIDGQNAICPGEYYTYEVNSNQPNVAFNWTINDGGTISESAGDAINVQWGFSPPYELTVSQISTAGLACESEPFTMTLNPISSISLDGPTEICIEGNYQYTAPSFGNAPYEWIITPSDAGTIISGQGSDTLSVIWSVPGAATLSVSACGATETLPLTIYGYPDPVVNYPDSLCSNETGLVGTTTPFSSYNWFDEAGDLVSSNSSPSLPPGYYELEVTNNAGCLGQTTFSIHGLPAPVINITTPGLDFFCVSIGLPIPTLYAINTDEGYTFEWFRNGVPLGVFVDTYTPTQGGNFSIQITDVNGCTSLSNVINLYENCPGGGGPPVPGINCNGVNNIYSNGPTCPHGIFLNTSTDYVPGSVFWNFDDPASGGANTSTLENPEHFFTAPGFYGVQMTVTKASGGVCILHKSFEVPAMADFDIISSCPGLPAEFEDLSVFTPGTTITNYDWDFGDPASGANNSSNLQNPTHVFNTIGTYNVTLTITAQTGCTSSFSKEIEVLSPPTANFLPPNGSCSATGLAFDAIPTTGVTSLEWDFGDPASGASNTSRLTNTFHSFSGPGTYNVTLTVYNVYACSNSLSMAITIVENDLDGEISIIPGSPICEGSSTTLSAPPGGTSWLWSDGSTTESIVKSEAGVYQVTVSNDFGCEYIPPEVVLDIIAQPEATIKVTEYNEYGQPADCFFDGYILCEGEDVFLSISGAGDYSYEWSSGQTGDEVIYDDEHGGILTVGNHDFEVTVTDNVSGCTSVEGPFTITVNPVPTDIMIISSPPGPICEQTMATLTVSNPDSLLTYLWSTGEYGNTIMASTAGEYFVRGISSFGCEGESNIIEIYAAPDIQLVPDGCHTRCAPDTICLPTIPDVVAFQWYLNDTLIPAPEGTDPDFTPSESGAYKVELFDVNGCSALSNPFSIDLLPLDTSSLLLSACEDGTVEYAGEILNPGSITEFVFTNQFGCDSTITVSVTPDIDTETPINLTACEGSSVIYEGEMYFPGTDTTINLTSSFGCDSIINLVIAPLPSSQETVNLEACTGSTVMYGGQEIPAGDTVNFTYFNQYFCDSVITVIVDENLVYEDSINLEGCEGSTVNFEGVDYPVGTNETFSYASDAGCDSIIHLNIASVSDFFDLQNLSACAGTNITLPGGLELEAGADTTILFTSQAGCDSTVQFIVEELQSYTINVDLTACDGETATHEGTEYPAGTDIEINLTSQGGCDSTILLFVETLPTQTGTLELAACAGGTAEYAGQDLDAGTTTDVVLDNQFGCDSTITVTVLENEVYYEQVDTSACEGSSIIYDGVEYLAGSSQEIDYISVDGCDSTILLVIAGAPLSTNTVELFACPGSTAEYNDEDLPVGSVTEFVFPNQFNCDSIVEVTVSESPSQSQTIMLAGCDGGSVTFEGEEYLVGTQPVLTYPNQFGCDSVITLNIQTLPNYITPVPLTGCAGTTINHNGMELEVGSNTEIEYSSIDGCDSTVIISVSAYPTFNFDALPSDLICWNSNAGEIEVADLTGGTEPFSYSLDGVNYQNEPLIDNIPGGNYTVYVQDAYGCVQETEVSIPVTPPLTMDFNIPTIPCDADSVNVQAALLAGFTDSMTYEWQHGLSGTDIPIYDPGNYTLNVTNLCETQNFEINVDLADGYRGTYFYIPNAFSPNGDGVNDVFTAYVAEGLTVVSYELHLFDRWGNALYKTTEIDEGWNGVFLDEAMNPGVYVWWLRAKVRSCREDFDLFRKGDVTILK